MAVVGELSAQVSMPEGDFPQASGASGLGQCWHPVLLGQGVLTVYTIDDSGMGASGLSDC